MTTTAGPAPLQLGHMRDSDAFSWYMERDPHLRSTVVVVAVLDRAPDRDALRARMERAVHRLALLRVRVVHPALRLATPRWADVGDVDLDWHLRHTSVAGNDLWAAVLDIARRKAVTAFDPARPLWELTVVEGLPDDRAAMVMVFHHALTDGIGGMHLAMELFDSEREPGPDDRPVPPTHVEDLGGLRLAWESLGYDARRVTTLLRAMPRAGVVAASHAVRAPRSSVVATARTARSVWRFVAPFRDTKSPVMRERSLSRHFDVLEVSLADLHRAGHAGGGHLNDAFLAAVTGGLRRYHEQHGEPIDELRVTLPISLRSPGDPAGGNLITLVRLPVPAGLADPGARLVAIRDIVERWRAEPSLALTQPIAMVLNLLPPGVVGGMLKHVDFLASNVPGFPIPVYLAGAKVIGYYPFGPTIGASVNVTLLSYVDRCCIGVSCDAGAVPDAELLMQCLREGFDEVLALSGEHEPVHRPLQEQMHDPAPADVT